MSDTPLLQQKSETRTEKGAEDQTGSKEAGFVWGLASAAQQTESRWGTRAQQLGRILRYTRQDHGRLDHRASD